jgi:hypothetical protein
VSSAPHDNTTAVSGSLLLGLLLGLLCGSGCSRRCRLLLLLRDQRRLLLRCQCRRMLLLLLLLLLLLGLCRRRRRRRRLGLLLPTAACAHVMLAVRTNQHVAADGCLQPLPASIAGRELPFLEERERRLRLLRTLVRSGRLLLRRVLLLLRRRRLLLLLRRRRCLLLCQKLLMGSLLSGDLRLMLRRRRCRRRRRRRLLLLHQRARRLGSGSAGLRIHHGLARAHAGSLRGLCDLGLRRIDLPWTQRASRAGVIGQDIAEQSVARVLQHVQHSILRGRGGRGALSSTHMRREGGEGGTRCREGGRGGQRSPRRLASPRPRAERASLLRGG